MYSFVQESFLHEFLEELSGADSSLLLHFVVLGLKVMLLTEELPPDCDTIVWLLISVDDAVDEY